MDCQSREVFAMPTIERNDLDRRLMTVCPL